MTALDTQRKHIAERVRELRRARHWTQAELAKQLELSQSRLSEIEAGGGSFTAEQLLRVLALFNVGVDAFVEQADLRHVELQNALARLGAKHLVESDNVVPTERLAELHDVIRAAIIDGSPRLLAALAPVLVANADKLSLEPIYAELQRVGYERRLAWVVYNTQFALEELSAQSPRWKRVRLRTEAKFTSFLEYAARLASPDAPIDVLDQTIRSRTSIAAARKQSSRSARAWHIVTALKPEDFADALRAAA